MTSVRRYWPALRRAVRASVRLAVDDDPAIASGGYHTAGGPVLSSPVSRDPGVVQQVLDQTRAFLAARP